VRKHIKPGTVLGLIAVVFAMTGSAFAAQSLITSKDIKDGTIKSRDLSGAVKDKLDKVGKTGKTGSAGANGAPGPQGAAGAKGDTGPAGAPGKHGKDGPFTYVNDLTGDFDNTNSSVSITPDGVEFGPYADGGAAGGSLYYSGMNGKKLGDISKLLYTASYSTGDGTDVGVPYLRVFLNEDNTDPADDASVIFSPNTQPDKDTAEDVFHQWNVTDGTVRYDDDAGSGADSPWATVKAAHANGVISGIYVTAGFSAGQNLTAMLRTLWVNDDVFRIAQF
jgi:hypothetical protein